VIHTTDRFPIVLSVGERRSFTANDIFRDPAWRKRDADGRLRISAEDASRIGLAGPRCGPRTLEVEDAGLAAQLLTKRGVPQKDVDRVWEAIAMHSSLGLADRRGLLTYLTHKGVFTNTGRLTHLPAALQQPVRLAYPRPTATDRSATRSSPTPQAPMSQHHPSPSPPSSSARNERYETAREDCRQGARKRRNRTDQVDGERSRDKRSHSRVMSDPRREFNLRSAGNEQKHDQRHGEPLRSEQRGSAAGFQRRTDVRDRIGCDVRRR
jgi:hypothetical protein